jgi:hypothetical protein
MKLTLRSLGLIGAILFTIIFSLTFKVPGFVEEIGKDFIISEIKKKTNQKIEQVQASTQDNKIAKLATALYKKNEDKINQVKNQLKTKAHEKIAAVVAEMSDLSCECRKKYANIIKQGFEFKLASLQIMNEKLIDFMKGKYMEIATELKADVRIFSGSNAFIFLLILIISFTKPQAIKHLFLPGMLLFTATSICSFIYMFEQNWLLTIIYNNYYGFAYLSFVSFVFLFLCDIALNKCRITTIIINAIFDVLGSASIDLTPC